MENVPRVAKIIEAELKEGGALEEFNHLGCVTHIIDMADYGLPQRRRRCIAGNFEISLLESYQANARPRLVRDVIRELTNRSEERSVGKEWVSTCRSRRARDEEKKKTKNRRDSVIK